LSSTSSHTNRLEEIGYALVRPFLYFDHFHIFDLFCTSTHRLYFDLNFTSTKTLLRLFLSQLYFDINFTSTFCHNFTSTFLSQLYFDLNFDLFGQTLLRPKLYYDLCFSTNKKSRFYKRSK